MYMFSQANTFSDDDKKSLEKLIKTWDTNGDGQLDSQEFSNMIMQFFEDSTKVNNL